MSQHKSVNPILAEIKQRQRAIVEAKQKIEELVTLANTMMPDGMKLTVENHEDLTPAEWVYGAWARCINSVSYGTEGKLYPVIHCPNDGDNDSFISIDDDGDGIRRFKSDFKIVQVPTTYREEWMNGSH